MQQQTPILHKWKGWKCNCIRFLRPVLLSQYFVWVMIKLTFLVVLGILCPYSMK